MHTDLAILVAGHDGGDAPHRLISALDANPRFRRDSLLGGVFHPGKISYRETSPTDSLHILISGDQVSAHVDEISPLRVRPDGSCSYAWGRVLAHNLLAMLGDAARRGRGRHGSHRCHLRCGVEWFDEDAEESGDVVSCHDGHDYRAG